MLAAMTPEQRKLFGPKLPSKPSTEEEAVVVEGGRRSSRAGLIWPVVGRVSSGFGMRGGGKTKSGRVRRGQFHNGIDIPMPKGTSILAAKGGVVVESGPSRGYGQRVVVDHGNGLRTLYAHCSKILVKKGQRVVQGQRLALVGRTGRATCNHLHFVVYVNGKAKNPVEYLPKKP
jgi:murein DD-endopeptidase MepM/ murein hydrolase activator NlpD